MRIFFCPCEHRVSSGTDIGKLFSDLPDDCAELSTLNATELVDGQYDAAINKVHSFIEDRATELAEGLVANQQRATISEHWLQHFRPHLTNSTVLVVVVTMGALESICNPAQGDALASYKVLLEWTHAVLMSEQENPDSKPNCVVVPLLLCNALWTVYSALRNDFAIFICSITSVRRNDFHRRKSN